MKKHTITHICTTCGTESGLNRRRRGNTCLELMLWLALLVPGMMYTAWRNTGDVQYCKACGHETMVPLGTPVGRRLHEELEQYRDGAVAL